MKKIIGVLCFSLFTLFLTILIMAKTKNVTETVKYYTIPRMYAYHYTEDKKMKFEIFVNDENSLIAYGNENSYSIKDKLKTFTLTDVEIQKQLDFQSKEEVIYKYSITSNLLSLSDEDLYLKDCKLEIKNQSFHLSLELGDISVYRKHYDSLQFTDVYGNYAYIEEELHLIGITLQLPKTYHILYEIKIGQANCLFDHIEKDMLYDSQRNVIDLGYDPIGMPVDHTSYVLDAKYGYYYFPITYEGLKLITELALVLYIDGNIYYIDDFLYLANEISLKEYSNTKVEGVVVYA